jgi:hypothetical protein
VDDNQQAELREQVSDGRLFISEADDYTLRYDRLYQFDDFFTKDPALIRESLLPNTTLLDGIRSANNYDPLVPVRYRKYMDLINQSGNIDEWLSRASVNVVENMSQREQLVSFRSVASWERVRSTGCAALVDSLDDAFDDLASQETDLIIVEADEWCSDSDAGLATITSETATTVNIAVDDPDGGWLLLADTYYPGWHAYVDETEISIYPADGVFRAVYLNPVHHEVSFVYQPISFYLGAAISFVAWICLIFFWKRNTVQYSQIMERE